MVSLDCFAFDPVARKASGKFGKEQSLLNFHTANLYSHNKILNLMGDKTTFQAGLCPGLCAFHALKTSAQVN